MLSYMYGSQLLTSKYQIMYLAAASEDWLHGSVSSTSLQSLLIQLKGHKLQEKTAFTEYKTVYILLTNEREEQIRPWLSFTYVFNVEKASSTVWLMSQNKRGTIKNIVPVKTNEKHWS